MPIFSRKGIDYPQCAEFKTRVKMEGTAHLQRTLCHVENAVSLGRVDIQLLQRILRQKMADARRKREPMPSIGECFQRGRCRFMTQKPPKR